MRGRTRIARIPPPCLLPATQVYFVQNPIWTPVRPCLDPHHLDSSRSLPRQEAALPPERKDVRELNPSRFDELTKVLATATSRRQALKTIAATTLGSLLGLGGLGTAFAKNKSCAQFCAAVFGNNTPAAGQCTSEAAHGRGLCTTCGPASPGGTQTICCPKNPDGTCTSYTSATCCTSTQTCQADGTCCGTCFDFSCFADTDCCPGLQCCAFSPNGEGYCCSTCNQQGFCQDPGC